MNERLKQLRKYFNLTQKEFANSLKLARTSVSSFENGKSKPSSRTLTYICEKYQINEDWIRTGKGDMLLTISINKLDNFISNLDPSDDDLLEIYDMISKLDYKNRKLLKEISLKFLESQNSKK